MIGLNSTWAKYISTLKIISKEMERKLFLELQFLLILLVYIIVHI